jgi:hypothetical protein
LLVLLISDRCVLKAQRQKQLSREWTKLHLSVCRPCWILLVRQKKFEWFALEIFLWVRLNRSVELAALLCVFANIKTQIVAASCSFVGGHVKRKDEHRDSKAHDPQSGQATRSVSN